MKNYINGKKDVYSYDDNISQKLLDAKIKKHGLTIISDEDLAVLRAFSVEDIEKQRVSDITAKATKIIEAIYNPLKQRKLSSIAIALLDKKIDSTLTTEEETLLQSCRDINTWITNIRTIENTVIDNNTLLADINWGV